MGVYAVTRERFGQWDWSRGMREQDEWEAHAAFMDRLADERFIVLGGPHASGKSVLLIIEASDEAEVEARLDEDPWTGTHLRTVGVVPWEILIGRERYDRLSGP